MRSSKVVWSLALLSTVMVTAGQAQDKKFELSGFAGYNFSGGFTSDNNLTINGKTYNHVSPTAGFAYGASLAYNLSERSQIGFNWSGENSDLQISGPAAPDTNLTSLTIYNYHGFFQYYFKDEDQKVRPYVMFGLGATTINPGSGVNPINNQTVDPSSETYFSGTLGLGAAVNFSKAAALKLQARWTPTYISSNPDGFWCGWYGCWQTTSSNYINQFELVGGLFLRF